MKLGIAACLVIALTVVSGLWQGRLSHRWGEASSTLAAAREMEKIPQKVGEWRLQSSTTLNKTALTQLECAGNFVRSYVNRRTGDAVDATLIVGPAGPTSVHRPEICLSSRNYTKRGTRQRLSIQDSAGQKNQFWASDFQSTGVNGEQLRVCYAWSTGGAWTAPDDARFSFAGSPYLYKLQISTVLRAGEDLDKDTAISQFLQDFVDEARGHVVSPPRS